jgi:DNA-directed RNA polymerase subunit omega
MKKDNLVRTVNDIDKCVALLGNNRFNLVLVASIRTRELRKGSKPLVDNSNKSTPIVTALKEIEHGKIGIEYLKKIR